MSQEITIPKEHIDRVTTKHVDQLSSLLRYRRFMAGETPQDWEDLLGSDVVGLTHPDVTAAVTQSFIEYNSDHGIKLLPEERALLLTTPWVHDWGELKIEGHGVGDVTFEKKTAADTQVEYEIFDQIVRDLPDESARDFIRQAYDVALKKDTELGCMFNAIERIGYLQTAIRAYVGISNKRISNWRGLVGNVLSNQIEKLLEYRRDYPYVDHILEQVTEIIESMFDATLSGEVTLDANGQPSFDLQKLQKSKQTWDTR